MNEIFKGQEILSLFKPKMKRPLKCHRAVNFSINKHEVVSNLSQNLFRFSFSFMWKALEKPSSTPGISASVIGPPPYSNFTRATVCTSACRVPSGPFLALASSGGIAMTAPAAYTSPARAWVLVRFTKKLFWWPVWLGPLLPRILSLLCFLHIYSFLTSPSFRQYG